MNVYDTAVLDAAAKPGTRYWYMALTPKMPSIVRSDPCSLVPIAGSPQDGGARPARGRLHGPVGSPQASKRSWPGGVDRFLRVGSGGRTT